MSAELRKFLVSRNVATSRTTPYHPDGNSQCERLNSTLWKTVKLMLHSRGLHEEQWDQVLRDALHAIRSLLCTATNQTPHERFLSFERRSMLGSSLPAWLLTPGKVLLKRYVRSKSDPLVDPVQLLSANHNFAFIRHADGRESSVSTRDLAPCPTHSPNPTVEHCLIHCSKFNRQRTVFTSNIRTLQINFDWTTILRTPTAQRYILSYLKQTGKPVS